MALVVFPWEASTVEEHQIDIDVAPDIEVYSLAFETFVREARRPGDDGLSEYMRLKSNAELFESLLAKAHLQVVQKYLERKTEDFREQDKLLLLKREFEMEQRRKRGDVMLALDEKKLRACLEWAEQHEDEEDKTDFVRPFSEMLERGFSLSDKQRAWVYGIHEKLFAEPEYQNDWSAGRVARGREVPTPLVLRNLPKKPPPRRVDD